MEPEVAASVTIHYGLASEWTVGMDTNTGTIDILFPGDLRDNEHGIMLTPPNNMISYISNGAINYGKIIIAHLYHG